MSLSKRASAFTRQIVVLIAVVFIFLHENHLTALPSSTDAIPNSMYRFAFGSCFNPSKGGNMWELIESFRPQHLILLGDQIYADKPSGYLDPNTPHVIKTDYETFSSDQHWRSLSNSLKHWSVIYDDHDYGINNADKTFVFRNESMKLFRDFAASALQEADSTGKSGVYSSKTVRISLPGEIDSSARQHQSQPLSQHHDDEFQPPQSRLRARQFIYKVIMVDTRSNKDPHGSKSGDFLGAEQWEWLAEQLSDPEPDLIIVGSSILVLSDEKLVEETWAEFPPARKKLLALLTAASHSSNIVILSGDIHRGEISRANCTLQQGGGSGSSASIVSAAAIKADLWEFTSSGLGHTFTETTCFPTEGCAVTPAGHISRQAQLWDQNVAAADTEADASCDASAAVVSETESNRDSSDTALGVPTKSRGLAPTVIDWVYQTAYPGKYRQHGLADTYTGVHFAMLDIVPGAAPTLAGNPDFLSDPSRVPLEASESESGSESGSGSGSGSGRVELPVHLVVRLVDARGEVAVQRVMPLLDKKRTAGAGAAAVTAEVIQRAVFDSYRNRTAHMALLEADSPAGASEVGFGGQGIVLECRPYWGPLTLWGNLAYRGFIAAGLLCLVVLPLLVVLWFVAASIWYICIGSELRRRRRLEQQYAAIKQQQEEQQQRKQQ